MALTADDLLDIAALEDTIRQRASETAWARYENALQFEKNRRRLGGRPRPIPVPKPEVIPVPFVIHRLSPAAAPAQSRPAAALTPEELRRESARKRATAKRRANGKRDRAAYLEQAAAPRIRALHREAPTLSKTALAEKLGISRRAVQHALACK